MIRGMSKWYEPKIKDIDITEDGKEIHIYLGSDDYGAIYVSLNVKDIEIILKKKNA